MPIAFRLVLDSSKLEREKDADAYAVKQVRLWRRLYAPKYAYPNADFLF